MRGIRNKKEIPQHDKYKTPTDNIIVNGKSLKHKNKTGSTCCFNSKFVLNTGASTIRKN